MKTKIQIGTGKFIEFDIEENKAKANNELYENQNAKFLKEHFFEHYIKLRTEVLAYEPTSSYQDKFIDEIPEKLINKIGLEKIKERIYIKYAQERFDERCKNLIDRMKQLNPWDKFYEIK